MRLEISKKKVTNSRLFELDGLRGIAAVAVVAFHYFYLYDQTYKHDFIIPYWTKFGYLGVNLFFIISGFVIFWSISKCDYPLDFIWSRIARLYPVFLIAVVLTYSVVSAFGMDRMQVGFRAFLWNLSMIHQYFWIPNVDGSYWTMTLELTFYAWMLCFFIAGWIKKIEIPLLIWVVVAKVFASGLFLADLHPLWEKIFLLKYIELFAAGICFYKIFSRNFSWITWVLLCISAVSLFVSNEFWEGIIVLGFYFVFYLTIRGKIKILASFPFVYLGTISYSLYLVHQNIGYVIINQLANFGVSSIVCIVIATATVLLIATFFTFFIEKPANKYLRCRYNNSSLVKNVAKNLSFS